MPTPLTATQPTITRLQAHRGEILHCIDDPFDCVHQAIEHIPDGLLIIDQGHIVACGPFADLHPTWQARIDQVGASIERHAGLLVPGFIDCHVHYPQLDIMGSHGDSLLDWLQHYTFPAEQAFANAPHAAQVSERFLDAILRRGTTTAMVYGTVHRHSVDAFFEAAARRNLRMICGKALMDRNTPVGLQDTATQGTRDTVALVERWHNQGRLAVAVTPRFAPTSTPEQLQLAGDLMKRWPDVYLQTHLSETRQEVAWVKSLFPQARHYLDVYDRAGLIGPRSVLGHCLYLEDAEWALLRERNARIAHCPSSNFFLGSGLFDAQQSRHRGVIFALGSDVGAGTSLSMLDTAGDAYLASALRGHPLRPEDLFYLLTLGGAKALHLDTCIGNFAVGKEADFIEIGVPPDPVVQANLQRNHHPLARLFHLAITKQGAHAVTAVYIKGVKQ